MDIRSFFSNNTKKSTSSESTSGNPSDNQSVLTKRCKNSPVKTNLHKKRKVDHIEIKKNVNTEILKTRIETKNVEKIESNPEVSGLNEKYQKIRDQYPGSGYDPIKNAGWKKDDKSIPYAALAKTFEDISNKSGRLDKIEILANFFRSVFILHPEEIHWAVYLCANEIAPPYENIELGVGDTVIFKALQNSTGRKLRDMRAEYHKCGDIGTVAVNSRSKQSTLFKPKALTVRKVFNDLVKVARCSGNKSNDYKSNIINGLYVASEGTEAKYITRHLTRKMKLGLAEQTVYAALARACTLTPCATEPPILDLSKKLSKEQISAKEKTYLETIKQTFSELPNIEVVTKALVKFGLENLREKCHLTPGIPVKAMLAKPTNGVSDILERFKDCKFTLEYKYDGERGQIHILDDGKVKLFSRNAEDNTTKFPDLVESVRSYGKNITSAIIDCEIVAFDRVNNKILPFQVLTHRKRKDVDANDVTIQVCIYAFDLIYLNGKSLLKESFNERRNLLYTNFTPETGKFVFADHKDTSDPEEITEFLNLAVEQSCEGLMVKTLFKDATYEPSKRSLNWLKCKKDYLDGCGDSLDLVT
eukprot:UN01503